jgi:hypothetical protein
MQAYWVPCVVRHSCSATLIFLLKFSLLPPEHVADICAWIAYEGHHRTFEHSGRYTFCLLRFLFSSVNSGFSTVCHSHITNVIVWYSFYSTSATLASAV